MSNSELHNLVLYNCVEKFSEKDVEKISDADLLIRDILFYGHLLQSRHGWISLTDLLKLVGIADYTTLRIAFEILRGNSPLFDSQIVSDDTRATFKSELIDSIQNIFYGQQSPYKLDYQIPGWDITGIDFINHLNMLENSVRATTLAEQAASALQKLLGISYRSNTAPDRAKVLQGQRKDGSEWFMILCVYPFERTLTEQAYNDLITNIVYPLTIQYPGAKTLFVAPSITGEQATQVRNIQSLFCMWDLSFVRMYHRIEGILGTDPRSKDYRNRKEIVAQNFDRILDTNTKRSHAYLAKQAIDHLEVFF